MAASSDRLTTIGLADATVTGSIELPGIADLAPGGSGSAIVANVDEVTDHAAAAAALADVLKSSAADDYQAQLDRRLAGHDGRPRRAAGIRRHADRSRRRDRRRQADRRRGRDVCRVAVATERRRRVHRPRPRHAHLDDPARRRGARAGDGDRTRQPEAVCDVRHGRTKPSYDVIAVGGDPAKNGPTDQGTGLGLQPLPGPGTWVAYDAASQMVHILGLAPGRDRRRGPWTVYVVEPHGNAVFADARLPDGFTPSAWGADFNPDYPRPTPAADAGLRRRRGQASIDAGSHAFAWRLPGVIAGALTAALLYLLTRILFRRRLVAALVGLFVIADGMFFVQSRIGMNDVYVGLFIIAAYTVFAAVWTGWWQGRAAFWMAMPIMGVLLGLALASKWVAAYAIGALLLLILVRSALGRVLAILGLIGITAVLGYMAISVPRDPGGDPGFGNLTFLFIMVALTLARRGRRGPPSDRVDRRGDALRASSPGRRSAAWSSSAPSRPAGFERGRPRGRSRRRRCCSPSPWPSGRWSCSACSGWAGGRVRAAGGAAGRRRPDPAARPAGHAPRRLAPARLGARASRSSGCAACLIALPVGVYILTYIPWAMVENHQLVPGWPPGHTGQTLLDLTGQMYGYHNGLTAAHPASSPWWAWPMNLKPVWFYQEGLAGGHLRRALRRGQPRHLVARASRRWPSSRWMAFRRRSLALTLIAVGFAAQWIPWARIDRAAFQYHYYTALPFVVMALAYFFAELWHGASRHTWALARVAAAVAIVAPAAMWLLDRPLCAVVGVEPVNPGSQACPAVIPEFVLTVRTAGAGRRDRRSASSSSSGASSRSSRPTAGRPATGQMAPPTGRCSGPGSGSRSPWSWSRSCPTPRS